ncbi:MAG: class I SAM-dependent methyltransferase [Balneolaceae bacterium]
MKPLERSYNEEKVYRYFSGAAWYYDIWAKLTETKAANLALDWSGLNGNARVLEVATGTGLLFEELVKRNPGGYTAGIDISREMLAKAKKRLRPYQKNNHFDLKLASVYDIPFGNRRFDFLINNYMFDLFPEKDFEPILISYHKKLKPGGKVIICSMTNPEKWYQMHWEWLAENLPDLLTGCRPVSMLPYLVNTGFRITKQTIVSQLTFPSEVIIAAK